MFKTTLEDSPHVNVSNGHTMYYITLSLIEEEQVQEGSDASAHDESLQQISLGNEDFPSMF